MNSRSSKSTEQTNHSFRLIAFAMVHLLRGWCIARQMASFARPRAASLSTSSFGYGDLYDSEASTARRRMVISHTERNLKDSISSFEREIRGCFSLAYEGAIQSSNSEEMLNITQSIPPPIRVCQGRCALAWYIGHQHKPLLHSHLNSAMLSAKTLQ